MSTRQLILMRHGHAKDIDPALGAVDGDLLRDLRDKGKRNAQRMGIWLARHDIKPDIVYSSPALRAKRTAEKCIKTSGLPASLVEIKADLYPGKQAALLEMARHLPDSATTVMMVGHNPGMEDLADYLSADPLPRNGKGHALPPAGLVILSIDGSWRDLQQGTAMATGPIWPKELPRLFPWPTNEDDESRIRPAYYYQQSSVIPWRRNNGMLQVLVIASSKNQHLVIPKGIHDPGLSPQESAAKEAQEEAGIAGQISEKPVGTYQYAKWDSTCHVAVYAMQVTGLLPDDAWPESHRGREWLPVETAAARVANPDVGQLILKLPAFLERGPR